MNNQDEAIEKFEGRILEALEFKYGSEPEQIRISLIEMSPANKIDIKQFRDLFYNQNIYPSERLEKLVYLLMDIKIELVFIFELDLGLYNTLIFDAGFNKENINDNPYMMLRRLSLDQCLILKSRILWERIMNFIYFLETGKELIRKKGKKTYFFQFIPKTKWQFLGEYEDYINWFDDQLRTPEAHKGSVLRKQFQLGNAVADEKVQALSTIVINVFWLNLLQIIRGHEVHSMFWVHGMDN